MVRNLHERGFLLLEGLLAASVLALFASALVGTHILVQKNERHEQHDVQARSLAYGGVEAIKQIYNDNTDSLSAGIYGVTVSGSQYSLLGTPTTHGDFTRTITISEPTTNTYKVVSHVTGNNSTKSFSTYITKWIEALVSTGLEFDVSDIDLYSRDRRIRDIEIENVSDDDITIYEMTVSWTGGSFLNTLREIRLDNDRVWRSFGFSPVTADIDDTEIEEGDDVELELRFTGDIEDAEITILFDTSAGEFELTFTATE